MKIKIITDRGPFVDGVRAKMGDIVGSFSGRSKANDVIRVCHAGRRKA